MQVGMHSAKSQLSRLVDLAGRGEDVIITNNGKPVARLVRYENKGKRVFGSRKGSVIIADDFDDTPADLVESFYRD